MIFLVQASAGPFLSRVRNSSPRFDGWTDDIKEARVFNSQREAALGLSELESAWKYNTISIIPCVVKLA